MQLSLVGSDQLQQLLCLGVCHWSAVVRGEINTWHAARDLQVQRRTAVNLSTVQTKRRGAHTTKALDAALD